MKKHIVTLFLLQLIYPVLAQSQDIIDTIYYNQQWEGVSNHALADYYRIAISPADSLYKKQFKDYYITGELQGSGGFIVIDKYNDKLSLFDGECISYYKNGNKESVLNYKNGLLNGEATNYYDDGLIYSHSYYRNNKLEGLYTEFLEDETYIQLEYRNGLPLHDYYIVSNIYNQRLKLRLSDNTPIWEDATADNLTREYNKGVEWLYYHKNGVMVGLTTTSVKDYGRWYRANLIISNNTTMPINFNPEDIRAQLLNKKGEEIDLDVYSSKRFMSRVKSKQTWNSIGMGVLLGASAVASGYSKATTTIDSYSYDGPYLSSSHQRYSTEYYDYASAFQSLVLAGSAVASFESNQWDIREIKDEGYLKQTTINPGETIAGYVHIKRVKGSELSVAVYIYDAEYLFPWDLTK